MKEFTGVDSKDNLGNKMRTHFTYNTDKRKNKLEELKSEGSNQEGSTLYDIKR
jgi:hypothetical protein